MLRLYSSLSSISTLFRCGARLLSGLCFLDDVAYRLLTSTGTTSGCGRGVTGVRESVAPSLAVRLFDMTARAISAALKPT